MLREPVDTDGPLLPSSRPTQAWSAVMALRAAAAAADDAGRVLATSDPGVEGWSGSAAGAYREVRAGLSARVANLGDVAARTAEVVHGWLLEADAAVAAMRDVRVDLLAVQAEERAFQLAGVIEPPDLVHRADLLWARWHVACDAYWVAVGRAVARLSQLRDDVRDHPWDAQDHVVGFVGGLWDRLVSEPAHAVWDLTGAAVTDPQGWTATVTGLPGAAWSGVTGAVRDPVGTAEREIDLDAWRSGRYGEGAAALAAILVPKPEWLGHGSEAGLKRFGRHLPDPNAPKPTLQTVDELLAGADLERSEHVDYGHTLRRHVDVGDDYLMDRLTHGTILDEGVRGFIPPAASRFTDLETANRAVTETMRANEAAVRAFAASSARSSAPLTWRSPDVLGVVMERDGQDFLMDEGRTATVVLGMGPDGMFVISARVDP